MEEVKDKVATDHHRPWASPGGVVIADMRRSPNFLQRGNCCRNKNSCSGLPCLEPDYYRAKQQQSPQLSGAFTKQSIPDHGSQHTTARPVGLSVVSTIV